MIYSYYPRYNTLKHHSQFLQFHKVYNDLHFTDKGTEAQSIQLNAKVRL